MAKDTRGWEAPRTRSLEGCATVGGVELRGLGLIVMKVDLGCLILQAAYAVL
jgi:hypothetical protein